MQLYNIHLLTGVVVPVVLFASLQNPAVCSTAHEYWVAEGVMHDAVIGFGRLLCIIDEVHIRLISQIVVGRHLFHSKVTFTTGIILRHLHIRDGVIYAVINRGVALAIECKVDGLAHLSALEQGGIALSRHLDNLGQRVAGYINLCGIGKFAIDVLLSKGYHIVG